jgi:hypothetical protein
VNVGPLVVADTKASKLIEPRKCPLDDPAPSSQTAAVLGTAHRQQRQDAASSQPRSDGLCIVAAVPGGEAATGERLQRGRLGELLGPEIDRQQAEGQRVAFRADAAFARPEIYEALEARDVEYTIRIPANKNLELAIEDLLFRSPGQPSRKPLIRYRKGQRPNAPPRCGDHHVIRRARSNESAFSSDVSKLY